MQVRGASHNGNHLRSQILVSYPQYHGKWQIQLLMATANPSSLVFTGVREPEEHWLLKVKAYILQPTMMRMAIIYPVNMFYMTWVQITSLLPLMS